MEAWLKILAENVGTTTVLLMSMGMFIFYLGSTFSTMRMLQKKMETLPTKQDLDLALSNFKIELNNTYVNKRDRGDIPISEHANLMARVTVLEKLIEK